MLYQQTRQHVRTLNQKRNRCSDVCSTALSMKTEAYVALFSQRGAAAKAAASSSRSIARALGLWMGQAAFAPHLTQHGEQSLSFLPRSSSSKPGKLSIRSHALLTKLLPPSSIDVKRKR